MTCADARHLILTADPSVLRERSDAGLRAHLDECAACAAAAGHVVADLGRLRAALIARGSRAVATPRRPGRRVARTLVPMALAAELALFAFLSNRDGANPLLDRPVIDDSVTTMLAQPPAPSVETREMPMAHAKLPLPRVTRVVASIEDSTTDPDTIAKTLSIPVAPQLQVLPASPRQQVAVIATSNPKITVVWITKGDSL